MNLVAVKRKLLLQSVTVLDRAATATLGRASAASNVMPPRADACRTAEYSVQCLRMKPFLHL